MPGCPARPREVESLFREGRRASSSQRRRSVRASISPTCADVYLYHLNFNFTEFNQQAGRAGRDGAAARIHLLFGAEDRRLNEWLIDVDAPTIERLRELYRGMRSLATNGVVRSGDADIAALLDIERVRDRTVTAALRIFRDSGLVEVDEDDDGRCIRFLPVSGRVDMQSNERYAEGEATRDAFARFAEVALNSPAATLERIINRPIYPSSVPLRR